MQRRKARSRCRAVCHVKAHHATSVHRNPPTGEVCPVCSGNRTVVHGLPAAAACAVCVRAAASQSSLHNSAEREVIRGNWWCAWPRNAKPTSSAPTVKGLPPPSSKRNVPPEVAVRQHGPRPTRRRCRRAEGAGEGSGDRAGRWEGKKERRGVDVSMPQPIREIIRIRTRTSV